MHTNAAPHMEGLELREMLSATAYLEGVSPVYAQGSTHIIRLGLDVENDQTRAFEWKMYSNNAILQNYGMPTQNDFFEGVSMDPGFDYVSGLNQPSCRATTYGNQVINGSGNMGEYTFVFNGGVGSTGKIAGYSMFNTRNDGSYFNVPTVSNDYTIAMAGDADLNGKVDLTDLSLLASKWNKSSDWYGGDFDNSGYTDLTDLSLLASNWGRTAQVSVPEPTTGILLGAGLAGMALKGSRRDKDGIGRLL